MSDLIWHFSFVLVCLFYFVFRVKLCSGTGKEWGPLNLLNFKVGLLMLLLST